ATRTMWVATERLPMIRAIYTDIAVSPEPIVPAEYMSNNWDRDDAILELIRGRLQSSGPTTASALSDALQIPLNSIEAALIALETQGFALRGQFTADTSQLE